MKGKCIKAQIFLSRNLDVSLKHTKFAKQFTCVFNGTESPEDKIDLDYDLCTIHKKKKKKKTKNRGKGPVVQSADNAIQRINRYSADRCEQTY